MGDTITATYADDVKYIDSRTGELCTEDTPEEYLKAKLYGARDVEYTVCALVELPNSMSYRYGGTGYDAVLSVDTAQRDSGGAAIPMLYLFDTADDADETEAEQYLSKLTAGEFSPLMYESKATARSEICSVPADVPSDRWYPLCYHWAGGTLKFLQRHDDRYSFPPP